MTVCFPEDLQLILPPLLRASAVRLLRHDPRPSYQDDPDRVYGMPYGGFDIRFKVEDDLLTVVSVEKLK